jgi:DNA-binding transcriptional ArsR family regulator
MNWAWRQTLTPTLKLVLMALADSADDQGVCWPSVSTLAKKCSVSTRTVRRSLRVLMDSGMLIAEARRRGDGSSTSNRYRLLVAGGDNMSPPRDAGVTRAGRECQGDSDVAVTPRTTNRIVIDPPQPGAGDEQRTDPADAESGSGAHSKLEYPKGLSPSERADAQRRLTRFSPEIAQQLLDELAARLKAGTIRISPLVYLAGLIKRTNAGKFVPEAALHVADARQKRRRNEAQMQRLQALNDQPMPEKTDIADCPLAKRIAEIRFRNRGRGEDGGSTCD